MLKRINANIDNLKIDLPKISVVIATYNGEKYIYEQLKSIFNQVLKPSEIIISDDSSIDNTLKIVNNFKDEFDTDNIVKIVINDYNNKGHVYNFKNACKYVNYDIVYFADQDDVWLANKTLIMTNLLLKYNLESLHSNEYYADKDLNIGNYYDYMHKNFKFYNDRDFSDNHIYIFNIDYMIKNRFEPNGCCMCFKKEYIKYFDEYMNKYKILKPFGHDYIVFYLAGINGNCGFVNLPLIYRRIHGNNVMGKRQTSNDISYIIKNLFNRKHYLYDFIGHLNNIIRIKYFLFYRFFTFFSFHSIKWGIYCIYKSFFRILTNEKSKRII